MTSNNLAQQAVASFGSSVVSGQRQQQASYPPGHGALRVRLCRPLYRLVQNGECNLSDLDVPAPETGLYPATVNSVQPA